MNTKTSTKLIEEATPALEDVLGILVASVPEATDHHLGVRFDSNTGMFWYVSFMHHEDRLVDGEVPVRLYEGMGESPWMAMFHALSAYHNQET